MFVVFIKSVSSIVVFLKMNFSKQIPWYVCTCAANQKWRKNNKNLVKMKHNNFFNKDKQNTFICFVSSRQSTCKMSLLTFCLSAVCLQKTISTQTSPSNRTQYSHTHSMKLKNSNDHGWRYHRYGQYLTFN